VHALWLFGGDDGQLAPPPLLLVLPPLLLVLLPLLLLLPLPLLLPVPLLPPLPLLLLAPPLLPLLLALAPSLPPSSPPPPAPELPPHAGAPTTTAPIAAEMNTRMPKDDLMTHTSRDECPRVPSASERRKRITAAGRNQARTR
jgi:hypothetical protein